jgi:hypothetical protein
VIETPTGWTVQRQTNGRHTNTFFRSDSPYIILMVEKGDLETPGGERGGDWDGMESDYRRRYNSRYKRIRRETMLFAGEPTNLWKYEIERKSEPRLRQLHNWVFTYLESFCAGLYRSGGDFKKGEEFFDGVVGSFCYIR